MSLPNTFLRHIPGFTCTRKAEQVGRLQQPGYSSLEVPASSATQVPPETR